MAGGAEPGGKGPPAGKLPELSGLADAELPGDDGVATEAVAALPLGFLPSDNPGP